MKRYNFKILLVACLALFTFNSCDKDFEEVNINPTQASELDPALQLTRVQVTMSNNRYEYWRAQYIYCSTIIQHNASNQSYWSGDKYNMIDSYASAWWDSSYPRDVKNVTDLVTRTSEDPVFVNFNAAARILRVYIMSRITDLYGDSPYTQAGKGFIEGVYFPEYDTQESIYNDFFAELENAAKLFTTDASVLPLTGDVFLGNDIEKWKRWANSLRLRLGMRLTKVNAGLAQQQVQSAISSGVMQSNDDIVYLQHTQIETNGNSDVMAADDAFRMSKVFVEHLLSTGDPRLPVWGMTYDADGVPQPDVSTWKGLPNGTDGNSPESEVYETFVRHNRTTVKDPSSPCFHMTYAEVEFLLAEAAVRGWGAPLSAAEHFERGMRAGVEHVRWYPNAVIDQDDLDAFVANNPLDTSSDDAMMEQIATEQWVQFYLNAMEAFSNWRRTGYPELTPVNHPIGTTGGTIPRRLYYPPGEKSVNPNFDIAVNRQFGGVNDLTGRVWWDVQ